jgi:hypothetical protein
LVGNAILRASGGAFATTAFKFIIKLRTRKELVCIPNLKQSIEIDNYTRKSI